MRAACGKTARAVRKGGRRQRLITAASPDPTLRGGSDRLIGEARRDILRGGPGDDVLVGGPGRNPLIGRQSAKARRLRASAPPAWGLRA